MEGYGQYDQGYGQPGGYGQQGGYGGQNFGAYQSHQMTTEQYPPFAIKTKLSGRCLDVCQTNDHGNHQGDLIIYDYLGSPNQLWQIAQ